jgi:putative ABC transport system permease protein
VIALSGEAVRAIARHKGRSALTAIGIAIAIAAVVWVVALGHEGMARYKTLLEGLGDNLVWIEAGTRNAAGVRTGAKTATTLTLGDMAAIAREVPTVARVSPQIDGTVQLVTERGNWTTRSRGVAPAYVAIKRFPLAAGDVFTDDDVTAARNVLLLGQTVRARLFGDEDPIGQLVRVNGQPFAVSGLLAPKGQSATGQDQDDVVMVPYTVAIKKLRPPGVTWVDDIVCTATSPEAVAPAAAAIVALVRERHFIGPGQDDDFNVRHPEEVVEAQMEATQSFARLLLVVAVVALVVGGIGIMNVMLASVTERTREIGVRLAVGATGIAITMQFLTEAVLLCLLGGATGALVSVVGASAIGRFVGWSLTIPIEAMGIAAALSTAIGVVFGYVPARRAAGLDPIVALRAD